VIEHVSNSCTDHPHCPFCGGVQVEEPDRVVCVNCHTEAPVENRASAEVAR
jgi:uncharacterized Zn finger protein (UPF0148 family)